MTRQTVTLAVLEEWGLYTADSICDPANLEALAPTAHRARQLIRRAPKHDRPVIVSDLSALAARLRQRGITRQTVAIYKPARDASAGWRVFQFNSSAN